MCAETRLIPSTYTCTHTHEKKGTSNTKSRVYFWRTIRFFQACFCHYHSWSSSCLKSAGRRTAQHSLCTEWDGYGGMMEKAGAVIGATLVPQRERETERWRGIERRGQQQQQMRRQKSLLTLFPRLDPNSFCSVFISTSPFCLNQSV